MDISDIVGDGTRVITIQPRDTIADSVDLLNEFGIGAIVVSKDGSVINGIISERDIVRHLAREQEGTLRLKVEDLMTESVSTCQLTTSIDDVMSLMTEGRFRHAPIVDDAGALIGLISLGDMVKARLVELEERALELQQQLIDAR